MKLFVGAKGIVIHDGRILLLRESSRYVDGTEEGKWDVPGGRIEPHETVHEGLVREMHEECGLPVTSTELLGVYDGFPNINGEACHVVRLYFACTATSQAVVLSEDHDAYEWVDPRMCNHIELVDDIAKVFSTTIARGLV